MSFKYDVSYVTLTRTAFHTSLTAELCKRVATVPGAVPGIPNKNPWKSCLHDRKSASDDLAPTLNVTFELACTATLTSEAQPANAESFSLVTCEV